jgi:cytokinin dehydrogenase
MQSRFDRRAVLGKIAAGAALVAFDTLGRSWVTAALAGPRADLIPALDGELTADPGDTRRDFGLLVQRTPVAVLRPGSPRDIAAIVNYANQHGLRVAVRGQGYSTYGQALSEGGVIVDSRSLGRIDSISPTEVLVDAGVRWAELVAATLESRLTPPVLPDNMAASVGGALSMGALGGTTARHGLIADNVLELEVVTGSGEHVTCSPHRSPELFEAVLGGLGQFGIIVRARLRLIPALARARIYVHYYDSLAEFLDDQRVLVREGRFDHIGGAIQSAPGGGVKFMLEAASYHEARAQPDDGAMLSGLNAARPSAPNPSFSYWEWVFRLNAVMDHYATMGSSGVVRPWLYLYLPDEAVEGFIGDALSDAGLLGSSPGSIRLYALSREKFTRPFAVTPDSDVFFALEVLSTVPDEPGALEAWLGSNRALYERARDAGGKRHPAGSIPFAPADWVEHFGALYPLLVQRKGRFDPNNVLTPGPGIFRAT